MRVCLKTNSTQEKGVLNKKNKKSEGKGLKFANVRSCRKRCFFCIKKGALETLNTNLQTNFFRRRERSHREPHNAHKNLRPDNI